MPAPTAAANVLREVGRADYEYLDDASAQDEQPARTDQEGEVAPPVHHGPRAPGQEAGANHKGQHAGELCHELGRRHVDEAVHDQYPDCERCSHERPHYLMRLAEVRSRNPSFVVSLSFVDCIRLFLQGSQNVLRGFSTSPAKKPVPTTRANAGRTASRCIRQSTLP